MVCFNRVTLMMCYGSQSEKGMRKVTKMHLKRIVGRELDITVLRDRNT
jgi:hypothetical protein